MAAFNSTGANMFNLMFGSLSQGAQVAQMMQNAEMARQYRLYLISKMPRVDAGPSLPIIPRKRKD